MKFTHETFTYSVTLVVLRKYCHVRNTIATILWLVLFRLCRVYPLFYTSVKLLRMQKHTFNRDKKKPVLTHYY